MTDFCAAMTKRFMMIKAGIYKTGAMSMAMRTFTCALMTVAILSGWAGQTHASNDNKPRRLQFSNYQSDLLNPSYAFAVKAMKDVFKRGVKGVYPVIGIAETDLNGDKIPEIIAYPIEEYEEQKLFCTENGMCPYYILEVRKKSVHTLGIITASDIDIGDEIFNGHWTITAYKNAPKKPEKDISFTGLDYDIPCGTPLHKNGQDVACYKGYNGGYGDMGVVKHDCDVEERYAHLSTCDDSKNTMTSGTSGRSAQCHLHYELLIKGTRIDPAAAFGKDLCDKKIREKLLIDAEIKLEKTLLPRTVPNGANIEKYQFDKNKDGYVLTAKKAQ